MSVLTLTRLTLRWSGVTPRQPGRRRSAICPDPDPAYPEVERRTPRQPGRRRSAVCPDPDPAYPEVERGDPSSAGQAAECCLS